MQTMCAFFLLWTRGIDGFEESLNKIESAADKISASLDNLDLILSSEKTKLCVFSKNNKVLKTQVRRDVVNYNKRSFSIRVQREVIANSDKIKFLGINLQSNLEWSTHVNYIKIIKNIERL